VPFIYVRDNVFFKSNIYYFISDSSNINTTTVMPETTTTETTTTETTTMDTTTGKIRCVQGQSALYTHYGSCVGPRNLLMAPTINV